MNAIPDPTETHHDTVRAIAWQDGRLVLLDQRLLPAVCEHMSLDTPEAAAQAIRSMVVRGAPAIGIAAAYGVVLAARKAYANAREGWRQAIVADCESLRAARPTAVNLGWAIERMRARFPEGPGDPEPALTAEAKAIHDEDIGANRRMGAIGAAFLKSGARVLTHCNAGSLATGGYGTALGVIRSAYACGKIAQVHAGETRPWLQGARLTAWELLRDRIPVTLLADSAAAYLMERGGIDWVIVGADRIAANGDVANKIGTYGLAVAARAHGVRFMVAAPISTLDLKALDGGAIPIENRPPEEIVAFAGQSVAAPGVEVWNPVFDVTPAGLIDVLVTEKGAIEHPDAVSLSALLAKDHRVQVSKR
ncbi:MAG: S-methyl-5-thioribose-1-phosphate isomerase [Gammaproteobacteria bacterium]